MPTGIYNHIPHTKETKMKIGISNRDKNGGNWKGDEVGYAGVHSWLKRGYGKADKCENPSCEYKNPQCFDWALLKGKIYKRNRNNFFMLCRGCHLKYDTTEEKRLKVSLAHKGKASWNKGKKYHTEDFKRKMSKRVSGNKYALGYKHTDEAKKRIGEASKKRQAK